MKHPAAFSRFRKRSDAASLTVAVTHIAFVLTPVYLAVIWRPGLRLIFLWLWFGLTMNGLLNLMHECAHYHVFKARWGSDILGRWVLAPLMFVGFDGYRQLHWEHHRELGMEGDPKYSYLVSLRGWRWLGLLARCLVMIEAFKKFWYQASGASRAAGSSRASGAWIGRVLIVQALFFGSLFTTARWLGSWRPGSALDITILAYAAVYVYGLMTLTLFAATLRAIAEHQQGIGPSVDAGHAALRNLACNPLSRLILGCYGFAEHATHHHEPAIPYYNLRQATTELATVNPALAPRQGYLATLLRLVRPLERVGDTVSVVTNRPS